MDEAYEAAPCVGACERRGRACDRWHAPLVAEHFVKCNGPTHSRFITWPHERGCRVPAQHWMTWATAEQVVGHLSLLGKVKLGWGWQPAAVLLAAKLGHEATVMLVQHAGGGEKPPFPLGVLPSLASLANEANTMKKQACACKRTELSKKMGCLDAMQDSKVQLWPWPKVG